MVQLSTTTESGGRGHVVHTDFAADREEERRNHRPGRQQLLRQRSRMERVGEAIARFFGSLFFIAAHVLFIAGWVLVNIGMIPGLQPFDPYPFTFLSSVVSIEFIFLATFVLMNQKHQIRRTEQWAHLHLQFSMLAEQEVTKNMRMLHLICQSAAQATRRRPPRSEGTDSGDACNGAR